MRRCSRDLPLLMKKLNSSNESVEKLLLAFGRGSGNEEQNFGRQNTEALLLNENKFSVCGREIDG